MSGKGNCYDNAVVESFFHTLKTELIYFENYNDLQVNDNIEAFVEEEVARKL